MVKVLVLWVLYSRRKLIVAFQKLKNVSTGGKSTNKLIYFILCWLSFLVQPDFHLSCKTVYWITADVSCFDLIINSSLFYNGSHLGDKFSPKRDIKLFLSPSQLINFGELIKKLLTCMFKISALKLTLTSN